MADRIENGVAQFELRDYLSPGGIYPYATLIPKMEERRREGLVVYLWSVAGHFVLSGSPDREDFVWDRPWWSGADSLAYKTAKDCLNGEHGVNPFAEETPATGV